FTVVQPGAALVNNLVFDGHVDQIALATDTAVVHQIELGLAERRRDLVLDDPHADARADRLLAFFDAGDLADVEADGAVKLEGQAARGSFRVAEHDADLLPDLVDEDHAGFGARDGWVEDAHGLAHEPGLQAYVLIADLALHFRFGHQSRHRVDDDDVHGVGFDQHLS